MSSVWCGGWERWKEDGRGEVLVMVERRREEESRGEVVVERRRASDRGVLLEEMRVDRGRAFVAMAGRRWLE